MTVLIGVGNAWRGDDAAGLEVARRVREARIPGVRVLEHEGEPIGLIDAWTGIREVIVVDAVSSGGPPGTVHHLDAAAEPLPATLFRSSTHAIGIAEAVELGRSLDRIPSRLMVCGVEGESFELGTGLTPAVEASVEALASALGEMLARGESGRAEAS